MAYWGGESNCPSIPPSDGGQKEGGNCPPRLVARFCECPSLWPREVRIFGDENKSWQSPSKLEAAWASDLRDGVPGHAQRCWWTDGKSFGYLGSLVVGGSSAVFLLELKATHVSRVEGTHLATSSCFRRCSVHSACLEAGAPDSSRPQATWHPPVRPLQGFVLVRR